MTNSSDLVSFAQRGSIEAFEQLVEIYQNRIFSYSYKLTGNYDDAQDLAQDVFVKAFQSLKTFRREADFGTWLRRITLNLWINRQRQNKVLTLSLDEPVESPDGGYAREIAASDESPLEKIEYEEFLNLVWEALAQVGAEFRLVLVLRDMEEYSYEEIASMLDCSLGTVKSRLSRGRKHLRRVIEDLYGADKTDRE